MTKKSRIFGMGSAAGIFCGLMIATVDAAEPLRATIELENNRSNVVFLVKANEKGILWQYTPDNPASTTTELADIVNIEFDDPEGWVEAVSLYRVGKYADAAVALGKIADDYVDIATLEGSPAATARYLQIESYRKGGMYGELAAVLTEDTQAALTNALDESLHLQIELDAGWAAVGKANWEAVNALLAENSEDGHIKDMAPRYLTQLTFMRGMSRSAAGETQPAIDDFYRTATFGYGNDVEVSGQAIRRVMDLLLAQPEALETNRTRLRQLHAVTYLYKWMFGSGSVPERFEQYAEILPATEGEQEAASDDSGDDSPGGAMDDGTTPPAGDDADSTTGTGEETPDSEGGESEGDAPAQG